MLRKTVWRHQAISRQICPKALLKFTYHTYAHSLVALPLKILSLDETMYVHKNIKWQAFRVIRYNIVNVGSLR